MRAQLRTYHAIPCLQAHQDPIAYKQLQDAPRLKSILKGASEDAGPNSLDRIKSLRIPRTNPVNLIFVLSQYAPKISELHFFPPRDFFDLVMRGTLSSKSRAKAFLWLIWFYLESDFSGEAAKDNPFGPGQVGEATGGLPLKVPAFEHLNETQAEAENEDTEAEMAYGERKRLERRRILEEDATVGPPLKKAKKGKVDKDSPCLFLHEALLTNRIGTNAINDILMSDDDRTRSPSPAAVDHTEPLDVGLGPAGGRVSGLSAPSLPAFQTINRDAFVRGAEPAPAQRLILKSYRPSGSSPAPPRTTSQPPAYNSIVNGTGSRRSRPETSHQKAVTVNRRMRIDRILFRKLVREHHQVQERRRREGRTNVFRAMKRIRDLPDTYDSEDDIDYAWGPGGLLPNFRDEPEDYGEEAIRTKKVLDRAVRRLVREDNEVLPNGSKREYLKRKRKREDLGTSDEQSGFSIRKRSRIYSGRALSGNRSPMRDDVHGEGLDDLDLDLLGERRDDEQLDVEMDGESGGEDSEDMTEDEAVDGQ